MFDCACGGKTDHIGTCHFGWHNPKTCPTERGNKITAKEKKEIDDMILGEIENIIFGVDHTGYSEGYSAYVAAEKIIEYLDSIGYTARSAQPGLEEYKRILDV